MSPVNKSTLHFQASFQRFSSFLQENRLISVVVCFLLFLWGCSGSGKVETYSNSDSKNTNSHDITQEALNYADSVLVSLTLEERVGQCLMPSLFSNTTPDNLSLFKKYVDDYHVGGVVLMKGDLNSVRRLVKIGEESKVPLFIAIDAEWGLGMRLTDAPVYPKNGTISPETDESVLFDYGRRIASESRQTGINMILGPVVDLSERNRGIIGSRSFGNDPVLVSDYGVAYAKGLESGGVISVAKHFPGHGSALADSHKGVARVDRNMSALDSLDLRPFREYINAGLSGVMAGHIKVPALDPDGTAASVSMDMLTSLLREEMNFNGLILTDAFDMGGAKGFTAADALKAGADLILCPHNLKKEYDVLLKGVKKGDISLEVINDRCRRILFFKALFLRRE